MAPEARRIGDRYASLNTTYYAGDEEDSRGESAEIVLGGFDSEAVIEDANPLATPRDVPVAEAVEGEEGDAAVDGTAEGSGTGSGGVELEMNAAEGEWSNEGEAADGDLAMAEAVEDLDATEAVEAEAVVVDVAMTPLWGEGGSPANPEGEEEEDAEFEMDPAGSAPTRWNNAPAKSVCVWVQRW